MTVNTKLDYRNYLACTNEIADAFFDEEGNFVPQIGRIMTVSIFLDYCVADSGIDSNDENMIDQIFDNEEIMKEFHKAVDGYEEIFNHGLTFGNAYMDAWEIVAQKRNSVINAIGILANQIRQTMTPEYLESLKDAVQNFDAHLNNDGKVVPLFPNKVE